MGKSYAGTTNWEAAQNPSEHLKTPIISGSIGVQQMFYRNGSSESRAMLYDALYEGATAEQLKTTQCAGMMRLAQSVRLLHGQGQVWEAINGMIIGTNATTYKM